MWQTSDGHFHLMVNEGEFNPGASLTLYTSIDAGATWTPSVAFDDTGLTSTSDGVLVSSALHLVYSTTDDSILYSELRWKADQKIWWEKKREVVFSSSATAAIGPALAFDNHGAAWCAFAAQDRTTFAANIQMMYRAPKSPWDETGLVFGPTDGGPDDNVERSARPIVLSDGLGVVYAVHHDMYWATREDCAAIDEPWTTTLLRTDRAAQVDPYASHFSIAADAQRNLHLATADEGRLLYLRYRDADRVWEPERVLLGGQANVGYVQATTDDAGVVSIISNANQQSRVFQSSDHGVTFSQQYELTHTGLAVDGVPFFFRPRVETPGHAIGGFMMFQQYIVVDENSDVTQRLLQFDIPAFVP